jgi:hypothetical protein
VIEAGADFFLSSTENYGFDPPRKCRPVRRIAAVNRNDYLLTRVSPLLDGVHFGRPGDSLELVLLASHLSGKSLFPVSQWPMPVYVLWPLVEGVEARSALSNDEVQLVAWGEMYDSLASIPPPPTPDFDN